MINLISSPHPPSQEGFRPSSGSAGAPRATGSVPPAASADLGPANPRMRIDRDLGMVVIEFRDSSGRVSVSLPSPRELKAYRESVLFGAELPSDMQVLNFVSEPSGAARQVAPLPPKKEAAPLPSVGGDAPSSNGLNKVA
jgi:hypothetical protein